MQQLVPTETFAVRGDRSEVAVALLGACAGAGFALGITTIALMADGRTTGGLVALQMALLVLTNALQLVAAAAVVAWVQRAYTNLRVLTGRSLYTPRTASIYFLVPGANFLVPHIVLREIWEGSDVSGVRSVRRPPRRSVNTVTLWWYLFIAATVTSNLVGVLLVRDSGDPLVQSALFAAACCTGAAALAGLDAIRLIDLRQALRRGAVVPHGAEPAPAPAAAPAVAAGWRAALLPVVTAVERDLETAGPAPPVEEAEPLEAPLFAAGDVRVPSAMPVSILFATGGTFAILQAIFAVFAVIDAPATLPVFRLSCALAVAVPFALLAWLLTGIGAIAFCRWLGRAYANLRMYVEATPRPPRDAVIDFVRGFGNPDVLAEVWSITMSRTGTASLSRIDAWKTSWRVAQVSVAAVFILTFTGSATTALIAIAVMFVAWARACFLARTIATLVTAEQRAAVSALASRGSEPSSRTSEPAVLPDLPQ
jgi:hypothetical protein